jgi:hypothetical protein
MRDFFCGAALLVLVLGGAGIGTASIAQPMSLFSNASENGDPPTPNQDCGSSIEKTSDVETSGEGSSSRGAGVATNRAKSDAKSKLAVASGVVCQICPGGIQCSRSVSVPDSEWGTPNCVTDALGIETTCKIVHKGKYTVACAAC